jgi:uncharacterized protein (DUF1330 family)
MSAYVIVDVTITDPESYDEYKTLTPASLVPFDGKFVVRGGTSDTLEGEWNPGRIVVVQFPTVEQAKAWWASDLYAPAKAIRHRSADTKMIVVQGV